MKVKNLLIILVAAIAFNFASIVSFGEEDLIFDINSAEDYDSDYYHEKALELSEKYPEILKYELLGYSHDKNPIYVILMTSNIEEDSKKEDFKVIKKHYLVESGLHARETVNPAVVMKMIETYAIDYYNDNELNNYNVSKLLENNVLHFMPMSNPDGHDLSKFGISSVDTKEMKDLLNSISDKNYSNWKSNIRGVDINRNFPDYYVDEETGEWVNKWKKYPTNYETNKPGGNYYHGEPGEEKETKIMMDYISQYDFRSYLSYHSRGEVLYYGYLWHPSEFNDKTEILAKKINEINGYKMVLDTGKGSGYSVEYFASQTLRPALTIETVPAGVKMPTAQRYYLPAYNQTYTLPLEAIKLYQDEEYGQYKLYDSNYQYVRDFDNKVYAEAHARKIDGSVVEYLGNPKLSLGMKITREETLIKIMTNRFNLKELTVDATDRFTDTNSVFATLAKNLKIANGNFGKFYPNRYITPSEYATILYNTDNVLGLIKSDEYKNININFSYPSWAENAIKYSIYENQLELSDFKFKYYLD